MSRRGGGSPGTSRNIDAYKGAVRGMSMRQRVEKWAAQGSYRVYSTPSRVEDWVSIRVHKTHEHRELVSAPNAIGERTAIVALYPRKALAPSTERLLRSLRDAGVDPVVVANRTREIEACLEVWGDLAAAVVVRPNVGRDFGAYQSGVSFLRDEGVLPRVDRVGFFNDSVLYPPDVKPLMAELYDDPGDASTMFMNFEMRPHIQSFAFTLSGAAMRDPDVVEFWENYYPSNFRTHAILQGEALLSRTLIRKGLLPTALCTWKRLTDGLAPQGGWDSLTPQEAMALRVYTLPWRVGPRLEHMLMEFPDTYTTTDLALLAEVALSAKNPTHALGGVAARVCGFPLKLDYVKTGLVTIDEFERLLDSIGIVEPELTEVMRLTRAGGTIASTSGVRRIWTRYGMY